MKPDHTKTPKTHKHVRSTGVDKMMSRKDVVFAGGIAKRRAFVENAKTIAKYKKTLKAMQTSGEAKPISTETDFLAGRYDDVLEKGGGGVDTGDSHKKKNKKEKRRREKEGGAGAGAGAGAAGASSGKSDQQRVHKSQKPNPLMGAMKEHEKAMEQDPRRLLLEQQEKRKEELKQAQLKRSELRRKYMKTTKKGQPVLSNMLDRLVDQYKKKNPGRA